jgi:hypothetical protein
VQVGISIGVSMTTVTGPVHGVKVVEVVPVPTQGIVIVVVEVEQPQSTPRFRDAATRTRNAPMKGVIYRVLTMMNDMCGIPWLVFCLLKAEVGELNI